MSFQLKWRCDTQGSTGSAPLGLRRRLALCPLPLLALEGRTLLMRFTEPVTLAPRQLAWLKDLWVGEVGEPSGAAAAAADTVRRWGLEVGVLDDVEVAVSTVVALVAPDATTTTTDVDTDATRWRRTRRLRSSRCSPLDRRHPEQLPCGEDHAAVLVYCTMEHVRHAHTRRVLLNGRAVGAPALRCLESPAPFTQDSLVVLVDVVNL
jgi:hypothetical protein